MTWRVSFQDYSTWHSDLDEERPPVLFRDFEDRAEAERELERQKAAGMTACLHRWFTPKRGRVTKAMRAMQGTLLGDDA